MACITGMKSAPHYLTDYLLVNDDLDHVTPAGSVPRLQVYLLERTVYVGQPGGRESQQLYTACKGDHDVINNIIILNSLNEVASGWSNR